MIRNCCNCLFLSGHAFKASVVDELMRCCSTWFAAFQPPGVRGHKVAVTATHFHSTAPGCPSPLVVLGLHSPLKQLQLPIMSLQAHSVHSTVAGRPSPAAFTAHSASRSRRISVRCSCSILPEQQLQEALKPCISKSSSTSSVSAQAQPLSQPKQRLQESSSAWQELSQVSRREAVLLPVLGGLALQLVSYMQPQQAAASKLGAAADSAWEALGGGPADLTFPESW